MSRFLFVTFLSFAFLVSCTTTTSRPELNRRGSTPSAKKSDSTTQDVRQTISTSPLSMPPPPQKNAEGLVIVSNTPQAPGLVQQKATPPEVDLVAQISQAESDGQWLVALDLYEKLISTTPSPQDQALYRLKSQNIVDSKLSNEDLEKTASSSQLGTLRAHASLRLGIRYFNEKNFEKAEDFFKLTQDLLPASELAFQADTYLTTLKTSRTVSPMNVGVILPLTGRSAVIGQRTLRGIEMGLGIGLPNNNFKLVIADSEGDSEKARLGAEKLIRDDNVIALIGDVLSKTSPAIASVAQQYSVPLINLSQRSNITDSGDYVFRNALTAEMQIHYLVRASVQDLGMKRFAIMYPNSSFGVEYANLFWDYAQAYGGRIVAVQSYNPSEKDFRFPMQRLLSLYYGEARSAEHTHNLNEIKRAKKEAKKFTRSNTNENILKPITDFDAVFVADGLQQLGIISSMMAYYDVPKMHFLGTNLWNNSSLSKRLAAFADSAIFTDSYQSQFNGTDRYKFIVDYKNQYKEEPGLFEIQGYDTALLLRQFILEGAQSRQSLRSRLSKFDNVPGAIGFMQSTTNREFLRPITAFTVKKGEIVPLKVNK